MNTQSNSPNAVLSESTIPPDIPRGSLGKIVVCVVIVGCLLFLCGLGTRDLWNPDEPRVAAIVKEMAEKGDFLVPRLNGKTFLEKPPLFFATCAMSLRLFGKDNLFAMRLPSALAGVATMLLCALIAMRAYRSYVAAITAALMLGTSRKFWEMSRWLVVDMMLVMFIIAAIACFYMAINSRRRLLYEIGMTIALAGAVMTKNLVGLAIPFVAMVGCLLVLRESRLRVWLRLLCCYFIAALIWGGWVWILYHQLGPDAVYETAWVNTVGRFTGSRHSHVHPLYFYFIAIPSGFFPWSLFLPGVLVKQRQITSCTTVAERLLLVSFLAPFVLLSLSAGKRLLYALPLFPILAVLTGGWIAQVIEGPYKELRSWFRVPCEIVRILLVCLIIVIPTALFYLKVGVLPIIATSAICLVGLAILERWPDTVAPSRCMAALLLIQCVSFIEIGVFVMPAVNKFKSFRPLVQIMAPYLEQGIDAYLLTDKESLIGAARFYLGREIPMLRTPLDIERFGASATPAICLTRDRWIKEFNISSGHNTILATRRRRKHKPVVLIGNRALMLARRLNSQTHSSKASRPMLADMEYKQRKRE